MATPRPAQPQRFPSDDGEGNRNSSLLRRSWHVMSDILSPFSPSAVASLPNVSRPQRYTRADGIPEELEDEGDERPLLRDYHAINGLPPHVRIPKKISTPVKVESKVWFANERTWVSWLNLSVLLGTLSMALFNASGDNVARYFAYTYAIISIGVLIYGYWLYQHRITMIRRRDPGHFDHLSGPVVVSLLLFFAVLTNFIIRVQELQRKNVPIDAEPSTGNSSFVPTISQMQQQL